MEAGPEDVVERKNHARFITQIRKCNVRANARTPEMLFKNLSFVQDCSWGILFVESSMLSIPSLKKTVFLRVIMIMHILQECLEKKMSMRQLFFVILCWIKETVQKPPPEMLLLNY